MREWYLDIIDKLNYSDWRKNWLKTDFTIKGLPKLQVISPKAGDVWEIGTTQAITWYRENIEQIKIELSTNSGSDWMNITSSVQASDQSYNWDVQNYLSQNCLVKIIDVAEILGKKIILDENFPRKAAPLLETDEHHVFDIRGT